MKHTEHTTDTAYENPTKVLFASREYQTLQKALEVIHNIFMEAQNFSPKMDEMVLEALGKAGRELQEGQRKLILNHLLIKKEARIAAKKTGSQSKD